MQHVKMKLAGLRKPQKLPKLQLPLLPLHKLINHEVHKDHKGLKKYSLCTFVPFVVKVLDW
jgi:hypothetical protein